MTSSEAITRVIPSDHRELSTQPQKTRWTVSTGWVAEPWWINWPSCVKSSEWPFNAEGRNELYISVIHYLHGSVSTHRKYHSLIWNRRTIRFQVEMKWNMPLFQQYLHLWKLGYALVFKCSPLFLWASVSFAQSQTAQSCSLKEMKPGVSEIPQGLYNT